MQPSPNSDQGCDEHRFCYVDQSSSIGHIKELLFEQVELIKLSVEPLHDLKYLGFASGLRCEVLADEPFLLTCNSGYSSLALPNELSWGTKIEFMEVDSAKEHVETRSVLFDEQFETKFRAQAIEEIRAIVDSYPEKIEDFIQSLQVAPQNARVIVKIDAGYLRVIRAE